MPTTIAGQMIDFVRSHPLPGVSVEVRVESEILGTGGGIANTADFWSRTSLSSS